MGVAAELPSDWPDLGVVLRGSLLMTHWFGAAARPAADLDLQCFALDPEQNDPDELLDWCRQSCRDAAEMTQTWDVGGIREPRPAVEYEQAEAPPGGESLWSYSTPGERYWVGWIWHAQGGTRGLLQIDLAASRVSSLAEIDTAEIELPSARGPFRFLAYSPEMLLAAKLSWLMRSFQRRSLDGEVRAPIWTGEPKDLFDVDLLLTRTDLRAEALQRCLLAVGEEDQLNWSQLEALFDVRRTRVVDLDFPNWNEFQKDHRQLVQRGPAAMLAEIVLRLEPLLGDLYRADESGFLQAIHDDPIDESNYRIYADWLEERGDPRAGFLQLYTARHFRRELSPELRAAASQICAATSPAWLARLFEVNLSGVRETLAQLAHSD